MTQLSQEEFEDQFTVIDSADGETIRDDHNGVAADSKHLWTIVDGDDGGMYALSGVHYVNRIGYIVTEEAWGEDTEAVWHEESEDDDAEDEEDGV